MSTVAPCFKTANNRPHSSGRARMSFYRRCNNATHSWHGWYVWNYPLIFATGVRKIDWLCIPSQDTIKKRKIFTTFLKMTNNLYKLIIFIMNKSAYHDDLDVEAKNDTNQQFDWSEKVLQNAWHCLYTSLSWSLQSVVFTPKRTPRCYKVRSVSFSSHRCVFLTSLFWSLI